MTDGDTLLVLGGGNGGATQAKAEVEVAGGAVGTLYGGGKQGGYADGIGVKLSGTASVGTLYAGVLHTKNNGNFTVSGAVTLAVTGGSVSGYTFGGGKVSVNGSESVTYSNDINLAVTGGKFAKSVYGLGYATGTAASATALTMASGHAVNVNIDGGTFDTDLYLGALADKAIAYAPSLNATVTEGTIGGTLYGGGFAQRGGAANAGAVTIDVSGGTIGSIVGGGSHVNNENTGTTTVDSVAITVSGGTIGKLYAGGLYNEGKTGYYGADTVTGDAVVTLTGSTAKIGKAAGSWNGFDTVEGDRKLVLDDFTGTCGTICDFDIVTFGSANTANVLTGTTVYNVGCWSFDVRGRTAADTAFVDLRSSTLTMSESTTLDLRLASAAEWSLAQVNGSPFAGIDCRVFLGDATTATTVKFGAAIASGTFAGYGFTVDDGMLKFGVLSA